MSQPVNTNILSGHVTLASVEALTALGEACAGLLGGAGQVTGIGENATAVGMAPLAEFDCSQWEQGRLFGPRGEMRWRRYHTLARVALLFEVDKSVAVVNVQSTLSGRDIVWDDVQMVTRTQTTLFLQSNDDRYPQVRVHRYSVDGEEDLFVRYA